MLTFLKAYIKSMRLYYAFITGITGWIGLAFYEFISTSSYKTVETIPSIKKKALIIIMLFLSWGINQIINDYLGLEEDRINAPYRPMVTGELNPAKALIISGVLLSCTFLFTYFFLQPIALIPFILGIGLNVLYEYAKGYGIIGNLVFGLMISMCAVFGFLAAGPTQAPYFTTSRVSILILIVVINGLMTFYTYFKDYKGDRAANKKTLVVIYGIDKSRIIALMASFLPTITFLVLYISGLIMAPVNNIFLFLAALALFLQIWTGVLYYKNPTGKTTYYSLATNFRACTCAKATLIALFNPELAMMLFLVSYIFIGFLFDLHDNHKA